jgi:hypothetical protein
MNVDTANADVAFLAAAIGEFARARMLNSNPS